MIRSALVALCDWQLPRGWALMMLASAAPKLVGPIMLAGAPLDYWSGKAGQNPMRYSGGMMGLMGQLTRQ